MEDLMPYPTYLIASNSLNQFQVAQTQASVKRIIEINCRPFCETIEHAKRTFALT